MPRFWPDDKMYNKDCYLSLSHFIFVIKQAVALCSRSVHPAGTSKVS